MTAEFIKEAEDIIAESRRANLAKARCVELEKRREHRERREAIYNAGLFVALVAGSLAAVYGIVALVFKLVIR